MKKTITGLLTVAAAVAFLLPVLAAGTGSAAAAGDVREAYSGPAVVNSTDTDTPDDPSSGTDTGGWNTSGGETYYYKNGKKLTGWQVIDGGWYYFDKKSGAMLHDKWLYDGAWYFLDPDGRMKEGFDQIALGRSDDGWYYFNEKHDGSYGRMMTGWQYINGTWYYFNKAGKWPQGKMVANAWLYDAKVWYFMGPDGKMYEGLTRIDLGRSDDGLYYFSEAHDGTYGHVMTGWRTINGSRYYFDPNHNGFYGRAYAGGTYKIGSRSYTFDAQGRCLNP